MGEYAHDAMRQEILGRHGYDIGEYDDDEKGNAAHHRNQPKRVKCPHCNCHPKKKGLLDHLRDKHGIIDQAKENTHD